MPNGLLPPCNINIVATSTHLFIHSIFLSSSHSEGPRIVEKTGASNRAWTPGAGHGRSHSAQMGSYMGCDTPPGFFALRLSCRTTPVSMDMSAAIPSGDAWKILAPAARSVAARLRDDHNIQRTVAVLVATPDGTVHVDVCSVCEATALRDRAALRAEILNGLTTRGPFRREVAVYALERGVDDVRHGGAGMLRDKRSRDRLLSRAPSELERQVGRNVRACVTGREAAQVLLSEASKKDMVPQVEEQLCCAVWERLLEVDTVAPVPAVAARVLGKRELKHPAAPPLDGIRGIQNPERLAEALSAPDRTAPHAATLQQRVEMAVGAEVARWPTELSVAATAPRLGYLHSTYSSGAGRTCLYDFCLQQGCPVDLMTEWLCDRQCLSKDALSELRAYAARLLRGGMMSDCPSNKVQVVGLRSQKTTMRIHACCTQLQHDRACQAIDAARGSAPDGGGKAPGARSARIDASCEAYYKTMFPWNAIASLLHRAASPVQLREISADQRMWRCRPILEPLRAQVSAGRYTSVHVGAAYDRCTQQPCTGEGVVLRTEMVLEMDDVPREVSDLRRWEWLRGACAVALVVLREWFDAQHILMFASGNRGPHIWLLDEAVLRQTTATRVIWLRRMQEPWNEPGWASLRKEHLLPFATAFFGAGESSQFSEAALESMLPQRLAALCFPSFDPAVALQPSHLHRLPFSVNEKSMRIALPFATPADMPESQADMPLVGDAGCSAFRRAVRVVQAVVNSLEGRGTSDPLDALAPVLSAPWATKAVGKRTSPSGLLSPLRSVGDIQVDVQCTRRWIEALQSSGSVRVGGELFSAANLPTRGSGCAVAREARVEREVRQLRLLVAALCPGVPDGATAGRRPLQGRPYVQGAAGRVLTYYPQLDRAQFVQCLSKASREVITNRAYAEVDFGTAHVAAAWGALCAHLGREAASLACPCLEMAARDKAAARRKVASENRGWSTSRAKSSILAALNQELDDGIARSPFLEGLVSERPHAIQALRAHPSIAGAPLQDICSGVERATKPSVREMSLMLQTLETAMLAEAVRSFDKAGIETVALIADGLLVRPRGDMDADAANAAVSSACSRAQADILAALSVGVVLDVERPIASIASPDPNASVHVLRKE